MEKYIKRIRDLREDHDKTQQEIVKRSGVRVSVGFDGHAAKEYKAARVQNACKLLQSMGIRLAFQI